MIRTIAAIGLVAMLPGLQGCSAVCGLGVSGDVEVIAAPDANNGSAIAVDVVVAGDDAIAAQLAGLTAVQYFGAKTQLLRDNPDNMDVVGWELVPGQVVAPTSVAFPCGTSAIFVYASYPGDQANRVQLASLDDTVVTLGAAGFDVTQ